MIGQTLSQKMLQKMSPQHIQLMKLLQVPTFELEQRIKEELEANPALEEMEHDTQGDDADAENSSKDDDNFDFEDYFPEYGEEDNNYRSSSDGYSHEDRPTIQVKDEGVTLRDNLERQLLMLRGLNETEILIGKQIIGSIDDDGYLRREPVAITDDLLFAQNLDISEEEVLKVLEIIQSLDPKGVGSRNLQEALSIQINDKLKNDLTLDEYRRSDLNIALKIIQDYFNEFSKKHFHKLLENLNISEDELKSAYEEILKLNPKPSTGMDAGSRQSIQYIEPDFFIFNRDGELELSLNSRNSPDLRINETYRDMIRNLRARNKSKSLNKQEKETAIFIKEKIESANNFIDSIKRRQNTLYDTMNTIMHIQYDYFLTGDTRLLRPMILKDVAERIGVDISTVSRVANSKYVQTEFGTKSLKEFFNESIQTSDGDEVTTEELNKTLIELINNENKSNPLSDDKLVGVLKKSGYNLSRRTVAKYRERLNIPVARLRKEM
ncbi:MAG TPA: RNA polymerase factor sigma-54 [Saprospiraceae bacterium]|nr:RNA polymerase factor sigma-54 [Saprospiraceae bacterium]